MSYIVQPSVANGGALTSPTAGGTVATIAAGSLPAGTYSVTVVTGTLGTAPAAIDAANMGLYNGATLVAALPTSAGPVTVTVALSGSAALAVKAIALGTSGSVYEATISATLVASS